MKNLFFQNFKNFYWKKIRFFYFYLLLVLLIIVFHTNYFGQLQKVKKKNIYIHKISKKISFTTNKVKKTPDQNNFILNLKTKKNWREIINVLNKFKINQIIIQNKKYKTNGLWNNGLFHNIISFQDIKKQNTKEQLITLFKDNISIQKIKETITNHKKNTKILFQELKKWINSKEYQKTKFKWISFPKNKFTIHIKKKWLQKITPKDWNNWKNYEGLLEEIVNPKISQYWALHLHVIIEKLSSNDINMIQLKKALEFNQFAKKMIKFFQTSQIFQKIEKLSFKQITINDKDFDLQKLLQINWKNNHAQEVYNAVQIEKYFYTQWPAVQELFALVKAGINQKHFTNALIFNEKAKNLILNWKRLNLNTKIKTVFPKNPVFLKINNQFIEITALKKFDFTNKIKFFTDIKKNNDAPIQEVRNEIKKIIHKNIHIQKIANEIMTNFFYLKTPTEKKIWDKIIWWNIKQITINDKIYEVDALTKENIFHPVKTFGVIKNNKTRTQIEKLTTVNLKQIVSRINNNIHEKIKLFIQSIFKEKNDKKIWTKIKNLGLKKIKINGIEYNLQKLKITNDPNLWTQEEIIESQKWVHNQMNIQKIKINTINAPILLYKLQNEINQQTLQKLKRLASNLKIIKIKKQWYKITNIQDLKPRNTFELLLQKREKEAFFKELIELNQTNLLTKDIFKQKWKKIRNNFQNLSEESEFFLQKLSKNNICFKELQTLILETVTKYTEIEILLLNGLQKEKQQKIIKFLFLLQKNNVKQIIIQEKIYQIPTTNGLKLIKNNNFSKNKMSLDVIVFLEKLIENEINFKILQNFLTHLEKALIFYKKLINEPEQKTLRKLKTFKPIDLEYEIYALKAWEKNDTFNNIYIQNELLKIVKKNVDFEKFQTEVEKGNRNISLLKKFKNILWEEKIEKKNQILFDHLKNELNQNTLRKLKILENNHIIIENVKYNIIHLKNWNGNLNDPNLKAEISKLTEKGIAFSIFWKEVEKAWMKNSKIQKEHNHKINIFWKNLQNESNPTFWHKIKNHQNKIIINELIYNIRNLKTININNISSSINIALKKEIKHLIKNNINFFKFKKIILDSKQLLKNLSTKKETKNIQNLIWQILNEKIEKKKKQNFLIQKLQKQKKELFFLTYMEKMNIQKIKIKGKDYIFKNLLKVNWNAKNFNFEKISPEAKKEFQQLYELTNKKDKIQDIQKTLQKLQNIQKLKDKTTTKKKISSNIKIGIGTGIGLFALLLSISWIHYFVNKNKNDSKAKK